MLRCVVRGGAPRAHRATIVSADYGDMVCMAYTSCLVCIARMPRFVCEVLPAKTIVDNMVNEVVIFLQDRSRAGRGLLYFCARTQARDSCASVDTGRDSGAGADTGRVTGSEQSSEPRH